MCDTYQCMHNEKDGFMFKKVRFLFLVIIFLPLNARHWCMNGGIDFNYARYTLDAIAPQSGYLAVPHFALAYKKARSVYTGLHFDGRWNAGLLCASSDLCNSSCVSGANSHANVADYQADWRLGYFFVSDQERYSLTPFTGIGFQHLSYQLDPHMMRYKYYQVYVPIGAEFLYHSPRNFSIGLKTLYRAGAYNRLRVSTPCVEDACDSTCDDKIKLNYSQGVYIAVPAVLHYRQEKRVGFHLSMIPFFDWNRFANTCDTNSDCVVFPIPTNKRWYLGVTAALGITF